MARTKIDIKKEMTSSFMANERLAIAYGFAPDALFADEFSITSFENILFDIIAYAILTFELILDHHKNEIDTAIYEQKSGTPRWYRNMSLGFQLGFDLMKDSDKFDNAGKTADQIEASKVIKYCSVKESAESNRLIVKVAGEQGESLIPLTGTQIASFYAYLSEIKWAGVKINIINNPADKLVLNMAIYRDVLVLDENGNSIVSGGKPVETAIKAYMKALSFDGELVLNDLIEILRAVDGVNNAHIIEATYSSYDGVTGTFLDFVPINVKTIPVSGYFEIENFNTVSYVV
jgi:hypothetical protein